MSDETKPKLREHCTTFSVYCGYGATGRAVLEGIKKLASAEGRSLSNFITYLVERYKK